MSDIDTDITDAFSDAAKAPPADLSHFDPEIAASFQTAAAPKSGSDVVQDLIHAKVSKGVASIGGGLREIGDLATGSTIAQADTRYQQFVKEHSYQPTDPTSQALINVNQQAESSALNPTTWPGRALGAGSNLINKATGSTVAGPVTQGLVEGALPFLGMRSGAAGPIDAQAAMDAAAANSPQSMGAAASAPRLHALSPELQQGVRSAVQQTGGAVPPATLARHVEADSLPVKMRLSEGQATQDPQTISQEMNTRGRTPETVANLNLQNQQLIDNVRELRDRVGPDVFTTNPVDHGASLIDAYKQKDAPIKADITAKYKALEDANGGQFPLDTNSFVKSTDAALSKALKSNSVPSDLAANLNEFRNGRQMTFEDFESLRSDAADAARSSTDGRQRAAAGIIRDQLEKMPLTPEAAKLKPLADAARSAAKARFDALDADPAYEAAVHGTVPEDRFVQRFITGPTATRNGVTTMRTNLADNPIATQTMGVATLDHLRGAAGIDPMGNGNFTQAGFNKALTALDPKLQSLVDPKTAEHLGTIGNVARYTQNQPRGSYVNNSNTLVGALAEHSKNLAEGTANKVLGFGVIPVGTMAREALQRRAATKAAAKSWAPGAGLTRLSDIAKQ